ncbi:MAG: UTP--glucose-1-phosphate uridylyltransferase GalU [Bacillota bacterium]|uniref:UTP--glucose-1-phosphate uridylyltransferase GalU n=1 Tax=Desulforudis sp. DRI-14 TaxID=3459793 RepID=UPI00346D94D5
MRVRKAVIPAAGLGVRFLPATKAQPKEMIPLIDKPTIQYIIEEAVASGITDILIITGRGKRAIEDHFDHAPELEHFLEQKGKVEALETVRAIGSLANIYYVRQKDPRGLGHAVACAEAFVGNEPFAVLLGDDVVVSEVPCLKQMLNLYEEVRGSVIAIEEVPETDVSKYGVIKGRALRPGIYVIEDLVEKPPVEEAPSRLAVIGRYILPPRIFSLLARTGPGAGGEIQLTDALRELVREEALYGYAFSGRRYDVGSNLGYLKATVEMALGRPDLRGPFLAYLQSVVCGGER